MIDEKVLTEELKRLKTELIEEGENTMFEQGRISAFEDMEVFINSLQSKSLFESKIQPGDDVRYSESLGCRVNLSQLKRVAKKRSDSFVRITPDIGRSELIKLLNKGKLYTLKNNV